MQPSNTTATPTPTLASPPVAAVKPTRPVMPDKIEDLGISRAVVSDLILRYLWLHGSGTLSSLHQTLKLSFPVLETLFHQFRQQQPKEHNTRRRDPLQGERELHQRWTRNMMLNKWLEYCAERGHRFAV